jgi:leucyl-tRNA synthetase
MFASPPEQSLEWSDEAVQGQFRFLRRLWKAVYEHVTRGKTVPLDKSMLSPAARDLRHVTHQALVKVTADIGRRRTFNTAIAAVMELLNAVSAYPEQGESADAVRQEALEIAVMALSPIVPHITHTLWHALGHPGAVIDQRWPQPDQEALAQSSVEVIVQVNGKLRARVQLAAGGSQEVALAAAMADATVQRFIDGKLMRKVIYVPDKLINLVV